MPKSDFFDGSDKYIKSPALKDEEGNYGSIILTIKGFRTHTWPDGNKQCVASFVEDPREWGFGPRVFSQLSTIFKTDNETQWIGKKIELFVDEFNVTDLNGNVIPAVRPRPVPGQAAKPTPPPPPARKGPPPPPGKKAAPAPKKAPATMDEAWACYVDGDGNGDTAGWEKAVAEVEKSSGLVTEMFTAKEWAEVAEKAIPF